MERKNGAENQPSTNVEEFQELLCQRVQGEAVRNSHTPNRGIRPVLCANGSKKCSGTTENAKKSHPGACKLDNSNSSRPPSSNNSYCHQCSTNSRTCHGNDNHRYASTQIGSTTNRPSKDTINTSKSQFQRSSFFGSKWILLYTRIPC